MSDWLPDLVVVAALSAVGVTLGWLRGVVRRRGSAGSALQGALAAYEESMRTTSYAAHQEARAQANRRAPALAPDDPRWSGLAALRTKPRPRRRGWWRR
jgi:hypothetical protein